MNFLRRVSIVFFLLAFLFVVTSFFLPSRWEVERSVTVHAPAAKIYPLVADLKNGWSKWSAFDFADPEIRYTYSGPESGAGASRSWVSKKMGDGAQTITKADKNSGVEFMLTMKQNGFEIHGGISFRPVADGTVVTWTDWGEVGRNPMLRWMTRFMDRLMGPTFEESLTRLKKRVEG